MSVEVGQAAPEFTLSNQYGQKVSLSDYRGEKNVVLMFYPAAFTGICTNELCSLRDRTPEFAAGGPVADLFDAVVISTAIPESNPEVVAARAKRSPTTA
mgnify:CR=1 FL=1